MNRAGAETMIMGYYRMLDKTRFHVDFAVHGDGAGAYDDEIRSLGGEIYHLPPRMNPVSNIRSLMELIRKNNYDIVHSHADVATGLSMFAAHRCGVPVRIAHSHNTEFQTRNLVHLQVQRIFKLMIRRYASVNFACSDLAGRFLFDDAPFMLIHNAVELERFRYDEKVRQQTRNELGCTEKDKIILSVARFNYQKNHARMIRIFNAAHAMDPNLRLLLAGDGELRGETMQLCRELGLEDSVQFLGVRSDVNRLYQASDLFFMPSLFEGLPVTGVEAQASGLKCLFSDAITREVQLLAQTQYCSLDAEDRVWAEMMLSMLSSSDDRTKGIRIVAEKGYDLNQASAKLMDIYEALHDGGRK